MNVSLQPLDSTDATALGLLGTGVLVLGTYGVATHSPNTVPYVSTVCALGALLLRMRRTTMPRAVTFGLVALAIAHLAGGLITVGDDVLYNAHASLHAIQYDHFVHATGVFLATIVLWMQFIGGEANGRPLIVCLLAGLGVGALNEMIEFLLTITHGGTHVGGYANTGWDLVANTAGAGAAYLYLRPR